MEVVDIGSCNWNLLTDNGDFVLDVLCSHSAVEYQFVMKLNDAETKLYRENGAAYLDRLAYDIHYSAPGVIGNSSPYMARDIKSSLGKAVHLAIQRYHETKKQSDELR